MLDIDFGTYPFVTSSSTISSNASSGTGVPYKKFGKSVLVFFGGLILTAGLTHFL